MGPYRVPIGLTPARDVRPRTHARIYAHDAMLVHGGTAWGRAFDSEQSWGILSMDISPVSLDEFLAQRVVVEPTVTLMAASQFFPDLSRPIPADGTDAERLCAFGAKLCYASFGEEKRSNLDNQRQVVSQRHGSVTEHATFSLAVRGITRACAMEVNRHRGLSISGRSTRYVDEGQGKIVLVPDIAVLYRKYFGYLLVPGDAAEVQTVETEVDTLMQHILSQTRAQDDYVLHVEQLETLNPHGLSGTALRKWARGTARNLLPHGLETEVLYTGNVRTWRHIIELRSGPGAEDEVRRLAGAFFNVLQPLAPVYFEDAVVTEARKFPVYTFAHSKI